MVEDPQYPASPTAPRRCVCAPEAFRTPGADGCTAATQCARYGLEEAAPLTETADRRCRISQAAHGEGEQRKQEL